MTTDVNELFSRVAFDRPLPKACDLCGASGLYHDRAAVFLFRAWDETARCDRCIAQMAAEAHWAHEDTIGLRLHTFTHDGVKNPDCRWCMR